MTAALGNKDSTSFPRSGVLAGEVWEVAYPGLAAVAVEAVRQWVCVPGFHPRFAGLSIDVDDEILGCVCRCAASDGYGSSAKDEDGRWQSGCGVAASTASGTGYGSRSALAVFVHRFRLRRLTADSSCGFLKSWRWSSPWFRWRPALFLFVDGAGGEEQLALCWLCVVSVAVCVAVVCTCSLAYVWVCTPIL